LSIEEKLNNNASHEAPSADSNEAAQHITGSPSEACLISVSLKNIRGDILRETPHPSGGDDPEEYPRQLLHALGQAMPRLMSALFNEQGTPEHDIPTPSDSDSSSDNVSTPGALQQQRSVQFSKSKAEILEDTIDDLMHQLDSNTFRVDLAKKLTTKVEYILEAFMDRAQLGPKLGGLPLLSFAKPQQMSRWSKEKAKGSRRR